MPGYIASYLHGNGRIGVLVEFAFREPTTSFTDEFRQFAHHIALHVAGMAPLFLDSSDVDEQSWNQELESARGSFANLDSSARWDQVRAIRARFEERACLMKQPFVRDAGMRVEQYVEEANRQLLETIQIVRFTRYEVTSI